jgi:hypothetical protein
MANSEDEQGDEGVAAHTSGRRSQARDHHVMDNDSEQLPWYRDSELVDPPFQLVKCFKVRRACISTTAALRRTRLISEPSWPTSPIRIYIPVEPQLPAVSRGVIHRSLIQRMAQVNPNVCWTDGYRQR